MHSEHANKDKIHLTRLYPFINLDINQATFQLLQALTHTFALVIILDNPTF